MHVQSAGSPSTLGIIVILVVLVWIIHTIVNGRGSSLHGAATVFKVLAILGLVAFVFVGIFSPREVRPFPHTNGWTGYPPLTNLDPAPTSTQPAPRSGFPAVNPEDMWALRPARAKAEAERSARKASLNKFKAMHDSARAAEAKVAKALGERDNSERAATPEPPATPEVPGTPLPAATVEPDKAEATTPTTATAEKPTEGAVELAAATSLTPPSVEKNAGSADAAKPSSNRPEPGHRVGDTYFTEVLVGDYATLPECEAALPGDLQTAVKGYIDVFLGAGASDLFEVPPAYIHEHIVRQMQTETVQASFGPMKRLRVELAFDSRVRGQLLRWWRDAKVDHRLHDVAIGSGGVLALLAAVLGYLKLDTLSRGYYTGRLQLAAGAVILVVVVAVVRMLV